MQCVVSFPETSPVAMIEEAPSVTMTTNDLDLSEGDCMTLVCQVTGSPTPSIVWKKGEGLHNKLLDRQLVIIIILRFILLAESE